MATEAQVEGGDTDFWEFIDFATETFPLPDNCVSGVDTHGIENPGANAAAGADA